MENLSEQEVKVVNYIIEQKRFLEALKLPENLFDGLFKEQFKKQ